MRSTGNSVKRKCIISAARGANKATFFHKQNRSGAACICGRAKIFNDFGRPALAVQESDGKDRTGTQTPLSVQHALASGHLLASGGAAGNRNSASLSLGSERLTPAGLAGDDGVGIRLQVQHHLAQDSKRWGLRWPRRWILFSKCNRDDSFWRPRAKCSYAFSGSSPSEHAPVEKART